MALQPKPTLAELLAAKKASKAPAEPLPEIAPAAPAAPRSIVDILREKQAARQAAKLATPVQAALSSTYTSETEATIALAEAEVQELEDEAEVDHGTFSLSIELNTKQLMAKEFALAGRSFCLIGAAGTGKTTTQRSVAETLLGDGRLSTTSFKVANSSPPVRVEAPSIAFVAFTRRASANLQRAIHKKPELEEQLRFNIMTIHALLEYTPETYIDDVLGEERFRFVPMRHAKNPLDITHLVIEEASMVGLDLWEKLYDALPAGVQIIFIGDINQLPPVFGPSIMNHALIQLPVVELTEVYRQAGDSGILANAHRILKGQPVEETADFQIVRGRQEFSIGQSKTAAAYASLFKKWHDIGFYDPEQDIILSPFNKQDLGTTNMNNWIAQHLGDKREADVFEIIAGFNKLYLAVGDKVMYNKRDGVIKSIARNWEYSGQEPQMHGVDLSRFGVRILHKSSSAASLVEELHAEAETITLNYQNFSVAALADMETERKMQCSHAVEIEYVDGGTEVLTSAGDFAPAVFSLGYVLTVHKAQGCEWRKVFIMLHKDHATMLYRELLYTAVTRAAKHVVLMTKDNLITKAIANPRIKGNTLADKIEFFNRDIQLTGEVLCVK